MPIRPTLRAAALLAAGPLLLSSCGQGGGTGAASTTYVTEVRTTTLPRPETPPASSTSTSAEDAAAAPAPPMAFAAPSGTVHRSEGPAAFVSQGGTTQCVLNAGGVRCEPHTAWEAPSGDKPTPAGYCSGGGQATGLQLGAKGNAWHCGQGDFAQAVAGSPQVSWAPAGAETKSIGGRDLVVLPYGEAVVVGDYQCLDLDKGVECRHLKGQDGFKMTRTGVLWSGTRPGARYQY